MTVQKLLEAVKNKLIELGYLVDDGFMKICSMVEEVSRIPDDDDPNPPIDWYECTFTVNDDYAIHVKVVPNMRGLHCELGIETTPQNRYSFLYSSDDIFDIMLN